MEAVLQPNSIGDGYDGAMNIAINWSYTGIPHI